MATNINYQQIYEQELSEGVKTSLEKTSRFFELSHQDRMFVEELIDSGYRRAIEDALDPEVLNDTASLAGEMGTQLYNFANLLQTYVELSTKDDE
tara:strand:- start:924 stop:1208 length:285 start_codon:yes stop_codon:yes gene_type:complete